MTLLLISVAILLFLALFFKLFVRVRFIPQDSDLFNIIEEFEDKKIVVYDRTKMRWVKTKIRNIVPSKYMRMTYP